MPDAVTVVFKPPAYMNVAGFGGLTVYSGQGRWLAEQGPETTEGSNEREHFSSQVSNSGAFNKLFKYCKQETNKRRFRSQWREHIYEIQTHPRKMGEVFQPVLQRSSLRAEVRMHLQMCSLSYNGFLRQYCMHVICTLRVPSESKVLEPRAVSPLHCVTL